VSQPRAARELLLDVTGLKVSYGSITALKGVELSVGKGEVVALIGANGAGKTSTLRAVSGMLKPAAGKIVLNGVDITGHKAHTLVPRGMAHAPEGRGIFPNLTVGENLELGAYLRNDKAEIALDAEKAFKFFPVLKERRTQSAGTLSGGEQQMLAISRALMSRPRLTQTIFRILREVNAQGVSILLVEQNAHLALGLCDWAYVLETGQMAMTGTGKELLASEEIRKAYLGE
jgi:branched-chain amino acid transport system ATP-binding protein